MKIVSFECFSISHAIDPRTGPSIALSSAFEYVVVRLVDEDGVVGWGETYATPGMHGIIRDTCRAILGVEGSLRFLLREVRWVAGGLGGGGMAPSAISIALEDLSARRSGVPLAEALGGAMRTRVRAYAASGGYIEGMHPRDTWFDEADRARSMGFTALKMRIGRYPIAEEAPLLDDLRSRLPTDFDLMADGNAAYTFKQAVRMGRVLHDLRFRWYEEPMEQRSGYVGYDRLQRVLDIELAGGEALATPTDARRLLERNAIDIVQPDPVIAGGATAALAICELAALYGVAGVPHTSNSAIGISAALQVLACLPDSTRAPSTIEPLLEVGIDDSPSRTTLLAEPLEFTDGWVTVPDGPGLGITIDEEHLRSVAVETSSGRVGDGA